MYFVPSIDLHGSDFNDASYFPGSSTGSETQSGRIWDLNLVQHVSPTLPNPGLSAVGINLTLTQNSCIFMPAPGC